MPDDWICLVTVAIGNARMFKNNQYESLEEFIDRVNRKVTEDLTTVSEITFLKVEPL